MANRLMFAEEKKPPGDRDWPTVLNSLQSLTERARGLGLSVLADSAVVARMTVLGEFTRDLAAAEALANAVLERPGLDPDTEFQVTNSMALLLYDYGPSERALEWLARAFALRTPAYARESVRAGIFLSLRVAEQEPGRAVVILSDTTTFADEHANDDGLSRVEAHGERGVAEWLAGDLPAAFHSWEMTATFVLEAKDDSADWKSLFVLVGHITGYLASMAATGQRPGPLEDGEPYAAPTRGLFTTRPPGRGEAFSDERLRLFPIQMALFADAVGVLDRAAHWASLAATQSRSAGRQHELLVTLPVLIAHAVDRCEFGEALGLAWEHGAIAEAIRLSSSVSPGDSMPSPAEILGPEGGDPWLTAEALAVATLVPIFFKLALVARQSAEAVRSCLPALNSALRKFATRSADPTAWHAAVELCDQVFMVEASDPKLVATANDYRFRHQNTLGSLKAVAYFAASTRSGTDPERSLALQLAVALFVGRYILPRTRAFSDAAGEFFGVFWKERFESARHRFSNPREVERDLGRADTAGPDRARVVLATVANGLGASVSTDLRDWLFGPTG